MTDKTSITMIFNTINAAFAHFLLLVILSMACLQQTHFNQTCSPAKKMPPPANKIPKNSAIAPKNTTISRSIASHFLFR